MEVIITNYIIYDNRAIVTLGESIGKDPFKCLRYCSLDLKPDIGFRVLTKYQASAKKSIHL